MILSVIVPAYNEAKLLEATLVTIQRAAAVFVTAGWEWELIVCDNNSTDQTPTLAANAGAKVVFEPVNQIARARNCGASVARGDWLVFLDADTHPSSALFTEMLEVIHSNQVIGGGATLRMDRPGLVGNGSVQIWNWISRLTHWAAGSFLFCESAAFRALNGFSLELFASEELDLSKRLRRYGRQSGRRFVILHRYPLVTSGRKLELYRLRTQCAFFGRALLFPRRTLTNRDACTLWYDGRR